MVAIEERVHPTPFRTRKLSSPSPMILHNVMWESRPLPKIVRDPLAAHSARGSFFVPAPPGIFLLRKGRTELPSTLIPIPDARCSPFEKREKRFPSSEGCTRQHRICDSWGYGRECSYSIVTTFRCFGCNLLRLLKMFSSLFTG